MYPPNSPYGQPFDRQFNTAVNRIAALIFPTGFDVTDDDPFPTEAELFAHLDKPHARMRVWGGASDCTIYSDPETNHAFRAWHDWTHWRLRAPFTLTGERAVYRRQSADLENVYPGHDRLRHWTYLLQAEVVAEAEYRERHGVFPPDERAFTLGHYGLATQFMDTSDVPTLPHHAPGG